MVEDGFERTKKIWQDHRVLWFVPGLFFGFLLGLPLRPPYPPVDWFIEGIWPEVISTLFAIAVINVLYRRFDDQRREKDLQEQLVRDASSLVNDVAVDAVHQLRRREWLCGNDGLLKGENLSGANLTGVDLRAAHLKRADLGGAHLEWANLGGAHLEKANLCEAHLEEAVSWDTHLEGANLHRAHLERAELVNTHLEGAHLTSAHLEEADLSYAYLERADLRVAHLERANLGGAHLERADLGLAHLERAGLEGAHLEGANLGGAHLEGACLRAAHLERADLGGTHLAGADLWLANLTGVNLGETTFDENTILPDGNYWTPDTDMRRFTDPKHPGFGQPDPDTIPWFAWVEEDTNNELRV